MSESQKAVSSLEKTRERYNAQITRLKSQKGFSEAYKRVVEKRDISTGDFKYFGISFESFLRYAQLPDEKCKELIDKLIETFK